MWPAAFAVAMVKQSTPLSHRLVCCFDPSLFSAMQTRNMWASIGHRLTQYLIHKSKYCNAQQKLCFMDFMWGLSGGYARIWWRLYNPQRIGLRIESLITSVDHGRYLWVQTTKHYGCSILWTWVSTHAVHNERYCKRVVGYIAFTIYYLLIDQRLSTIWRDYYILSTVHLDPSDTETLRWACNRILEWNLCGQFGFQTTCMSQYRY